MDLRNIELARIRLDRTQTRAFVRQNVVDEYAEQIASGEEMDPVVVFDAGKQLHLSVGFHRYWAHKKLGRTEILCEVCEGDVWDAIQYGIQDNLQHRGERVSTADRVHNVRLVLKMKPEMSNSAIAKLCEISDKTVDKYRREMEATSEIPKSEKRVGLDGHVRSNPRANSARNSTTDKAVGLATGQTPQRDWTYDRKLAVKYAEALGRAIDDLHCVRPAKDRHDKALAMSLELVKILRSWN